MRTTKGFSSLHLFTKDMVSSAAKVQKQDENFSCNGLVSVIK